MFRCAIFVLTFSVRDGRREQVTGTDSFSLGVTGPKEEWTRTARDRLEVKSPEREREVEPLEDKGEIDF